GGTLPLSQLAQIRESRGPNVIFRENGQRRFAIAIQPSARDVSTLVAQFQKQVRETVKLPERYSIRFEGEFEARQEAATFIGLFFVLIVGVILVLLQRYFG